MAEERHWKSGGSNDRGDEQRCVQAAFHRFGKLVWSGFGVGLTGWLLGCESAVETPPAPKTGPAPAAATSDLPDSNLAPGQTLTGPPPGPDRSVSSANPRDAARPAAEDTVGDSSPKAGSMASTPDPATLPKQEATSNAAASNTAASNTAAANTAAGGLRDDDGCLPKRRLPPLTLVQVDPADPEALAAFGLQASVSQHLFLVTDHPDQDAFAEFHAVVQQAVEQWVAFFGADPRRFAAWQLTCFLVVDPAKFAAAGLLPPPGHLPRGELPPGGWQYGNQIWVNHQPGPYYTRHMLLHEGTHAFCAYNFGALGAPWLAEGLAEYLALHRWQDERLELATRRISKDDVPYWGRVKLIKDSYQTGAPKTLVEVLRFPPQAFPQTESYAWSWAAVSLFDQHPRCRAVFRQHLQELGTRTTNDWNRQFLADLPLGLEQLETQWQVDTLSLQYGHDFARTAIQWAADTRPAEEVWEVTIPADGAWHATGLKLLPGQWEVVADGEYQIGREDEQAWLSRPDGITIRYVGGAPLGVLQYALQGQRPILAGMTALVEPQPVGTRAVITATGEDLFLRVNDWPNRLDDNVGQVVVRGRRLAESRGASSPPPP